MNAEHARAIANMATLAPRGNLRKIYDEIRRKAEAGWRHCRLSMGLFNIEDKEGFESTFKILREQLEINGYEVSNLNGLLEFTIKW